MAFDFDHTIVDGNSDIVAKELLHTKPPVYQRSECWVNYMQSIFTLLHEQGVDETSYTQAIANIPPTPDILELFQFLKDSGAEIIIISDSNTVFIDKWLSTHKVSDVIKSIYTNPASFDTTGLLNVSMFHCQNSCKLCPENLCKGSVLHEYLKIRNEEGVTFSNIVYVGDGKNDFCPSTKLSDVDYLFARRGYYLERLLGNEENKKQVMANFFFWSQTSDIMQNLSKCFKL